MAFLAQFAAAARLCRVHGDARAGPDRFETAVE
jgi:hypothetical protein